MVLKKDAKDLLYGTCHKKRKLLSEMENRKVMKVFGNVMRKEEMENMVATGYVEGKRARGRQRKPT